MSELHEPGGNAMKDAFLTPSATKDAFIAFPPRRHQALPDQRVLGRPRGDSS